MLDIGKQIKKLREDKQITGKDLAAQIGLSQSQMSRLEKGQRRVDTEILARIAEALEVSPAVFFSGRVIDSTDRDPLTLRREKQLAIAELHGQLGRLIRSERRKRHLTSDDLARKTGTTKAYVLAVEQGRRNGLDGDFLTRACRILAIDPFTVVELQDKIIRDLKNRVHELDRRLASLGHEDADVPPASTPILVGDESVYPNEFDDNGHPMAAVEGFLTLPQLESHTTFALRVQGSDMETAGPVSFIEGDLVAFASDRSAESGEFAFVRYGDDETTFRRIYFDERNQIRLQALRDEVSPILLDQKSVVSAWPLVGHVRMTS